MTQGNRPQGPESFNAYNGATSKGLKRFPDYVLCGQINLHKSPECAAALAKYIDKQWDFLRINHNGIISSKQLEINRNPEAHGGRKDGKPLTVAEWETIQKENNELKLKKLVAAEKASTTRPRSRSRSGARGTRGRARGSSRRGSRGRGPRGSRGGITDRGARLDREPAASESGREDQGVRGDP